MLKQDIKQFQCHMALIIFFTSINKLDIQSLIWILCFISINLAGYTKVVN